MLEVVGSFGKGRGSRISENFGSEGRLKISEILVREHSFLSPLHVYLSECVCGARSLVQVAFPILFKL